MPELIGKLQATFKSTLHPYHSLTYTDIDRHIYG